MREFKIKNSLSNYMCYLKEQRALILKEHPDGNILMKELIRQVSKIWATMNDQQKQPYR